MGSVMDVYKLMGFNDASGSVDCTHVNWRRCPVSLSNFCIGKKKTPTLYFLGVVDHNKRITVCSNAYCGAANDKQIVKVVPEMHAVYLRMCNTSYTTLRETWLWCKVLISLQTAAFCSWVVWWILVASSILWNRHVGANFMSLFEKMLSARLSFLNSFSDSSSSHGVAFS